MRTLAAVLALVACVHAGIWALLRPVGIAPDVTQQLASISYSPFADSSHPDRGVRPTAEQIRSDLRTIAPYTRAIRTYYSRRFVLRQRPRGENRAGCITPRPEPRH